GAAGESSTKNSAESGTSTQSQSTEADIKKAEKLKADIAKLKEMLAEAKTQLDLLKRKLDLDSDTFYSKPDYAHDAAGKASLDDLKNKIANKQISVNDPKQKLEQLKLKAGPSADANKPPPPQN